MAIKWRHDNVATFVFSVNIKELFNALVLTRFCPILGYMSKFELRTFGRFDIENLMSNEKQDLTPLHYSLAFACAS